MPEFTGYEKRTLELGFGKDPIAGPEAEALRKIIDTFPWIMEVAECKFDPEVAKAGLLAAGAAANFHQAILKYQEKESTK